MSELEPKLVGFDCPLGSYPSPLVPIVQDDLDYYAAYLDAKNTIHLERLESDSKFIFLTDLPPETRAKLKGFDCRKHRLFAKTKNDVCFYASNREEAFFTVLLNDNNFSSNNPFFRLSLSEDTGDLAIFNEELERCENYLRERHPEILSEWKKDRANLKLSKKLVRLPFRRNILPLTNSAVNSFESFFGFVLGSFNQEIISSDGLENYSYENQNLRLKFQPVSFSWVALHPQPRGVIMFIGGAFFGSFPILFYRHLLETLYQEGYTLVALPFRFSLRHWQIAHSLLEEQHQLQKILPDLAKRYGYSASIYEDVLSYQWLGHSLGCKYIALLELLSGCDDSVAAALPKELEEIYRNSAGILNQSSVLLAPVLDGDLKSAIPISALATLFNRLGVNVRPCRRETLSLIRQSSLFSHTAMISFNQDTIAGSLLDSNPDTSDVLWLSQYLEQKSSLIKGLPGKHYDPVGWRIGPLIADFYPLPQGKFIKPLALWKTGSQSVSFCRSFSILQYQYEAI